MQLFADRFVMHDANAATDLVTGNRVVLTLAHGAEDRKQQQWAAWCETLRKLHHPALAQLVDYGEVGRGQRFEAWQCKEGWGEPSRSGEIWERAFAVLRACGLFETAEQATSPGATPGIVHQSRRAVAVLGELFEPAGLVRPKVAALWGPRGAGKGTVVGELARMARVRGFVPISVRLVAALSNRLAGRSLFLIDDGERGLGWRVLVSATLRSRLPHVLLFVGAEEVPSVDGVRLEPLTVDTLVNAVRPPAPSHAAAIRLRSAAIQACGWPGRFARLLYGEGRGAVRVAEQAAVYEVDHSPSTTCQDSRAQRHAPEELIALRRRIDSAVQLIDAGRHAPGERLLRQATGAVLRRGDWATAGDGSLALAGLLLRRGRARDAQVALRHASDYWNRAAGPENLTKLVDVAVLNGTALIELAQVEQAETVLSAADAAARSAGDPARLLHAQVCLARVLFWRGRYDEAEQTLGSLAEIKGHDRWSMFVRRVGVAVAVGRRAMDLAVSRSAEAVRQATEAGDDCLVAEAWYGAAFAHLAVGDIDGVERDVAACLTAARALREPLHAARVRLILAEAFRRSGRASAAARLLERISHLGPAVLPPIVRVRCDLLRDLLSSGVADEVVSRHVASSGLKALALFVPNGRQMRRVDAFDPVIDDIVYILDVCQTSDDEQSILVEVCRRIRGRVHAAAAACLVADGAAWMPIASDGERMEPAIATRIVAAGATIAPRRADDRLEAGAPIRYAGSIIGVLVARWAIGTPHDLGHVAPLLTAAAAAVAPILSSAVARRRRTPVPGLSELIGISPAMAEVRRAVERAASAPFAVLIEGESGCGKELVARAVHRYSPRRERAFGTLNCAALPDDLVEAELFGHARGAFTGAVADRPGVFEEAHGGTLFMDEIGELSLRAQAKVLRVLQDGELRRVGENTSRRIDVRIVSATNRDLRQEVAAARFRLDLSYRLDVIRIVVPSLRERREDIAVLADHFWRESAARVGSRATLATATMAALARYDWPGNVRELQNVLASLVVRSPKRGVVPPSALGPQFGERRYTEASRLDEARRMFEERFVRAALVRTGGRRTWAARELGVTRQGLTKLMARLGIEADDDESATSSSPRSG